MCLDDSDYLRGLMDLICGVGEMNLTWKIENFIFLMVAVAWGRFQRINDQDHVRP
jgi:hypothetical protein